MIFILCRERPLPRGPERHQGRRGNEHGDFSCERGRLRQGPLHGRGLHHELYGRTDGGEGVD